MTKRTSKKSEEKFIPSTFLHHVILTSVGRGAQELPSEQRFSDYVCLDYNIRGMTGNLEELTQACLDTCTSLTLGEKKLELTDKVVELLKGVIKEQFDIVKLKEGDSVDMGFFCGVGLPLDDLNFSEILKHPSWNLIYAVTYISHQDNAVTAVSIAPFAGSTTEKKLALPRDFNLIPQYGVDIYMDESPEVSEAYSQMKESYDHYQEVLEKGGYDEYGNYIAPQPQAKPMNYRVSYNKDEGMLIKTKNNQC